MPTKTKVAVVQMTSSVDVARNLETVERITREAAADGARLIVLPECFAYLGPDVDRRAIVEPLPDGGPILERMRAIAKGTGAELVLGGFWERGSREGFARNSCVHLGPGGKVLAVYRKIHLFDVDLPDGTRLEESASVEPGDSVIVTDTAAGRLGLSICYDLRFPELYRRLVDAGATLLAIPAAFTLTTGKDHWRPLLRARAIESQAYVLAAAQTGKHGHGRQSYGHALIVDPWGTVLAEHGEGEGYASAWLDPEVVAGVRRSLPSLTHRRLG